MHGILSAAVVAVLATCGHAAAAVAPSSTSSTTTSSPEYVRDGTTTYCYYINQGLDVATFDTSKVTLEGRGRECPVLVTITQTSKSPVSVDAPVEYALSASKNYPDDKTGPSKLGGTALDPITRRPVEISHANVHACSLPSVCDVFREGENRRISEQQTGNFTTNRTAQFTPTLSFTVPGEYAVFAHVVLPPRDAHNESFHLVAFTTTTVASTNSSSSSSNNATESEEEVGSTTPATTVPTPTPSSSAPSATPTITSAAGARVALFARGWCDGVGRCLSASRILI